MNEVNEVKDEEKNVAEKKTKKKSGRIEILKI